MSEQLPDLTSKPEYEIVPWTTQQTFVGVFFTIVPWIAFTFLISLLNPKSVPAHIAYSSQVDTLNAIVVFVFDVLVEAAFLIAPLYFSMRTVHFTAPRQSIWQVLGLRKCKFWSALLLVLVFFAGVYLLSWFYDYLITTFHLHLQTNSQTVLDEGRKAPITTYVTLFVAVLVAPICEELFFRSFVLMGLLRDMSISWGIVLSSLIFAVAHGDVGSFPLLFCIGLALAFLRWRTRSIWPGILLHTLNNAFSALSIVILLHS